MEIRDLPARVKAGPRSCQACGAPILHGRRKYCAPECRRRLVLKLSSAIGLLRAMHTRCAAFSFTEDTVVLHVAVYGSREVYGFVWARGPGKKPSDDLARLVEELGGAWWRENRLQGSRHQASLSVLGLAAANAGRAEALRPSKMAVPRVPSRNLTVLRISREDLLAKDAYDKIKAAYRREAMRHHPDKDGDAAMFRRVHEAYQELGRWVAAPVVRKRKGIPGKWSFDGKTWSPPLS